MENLVGMMRDPTASYNLTWAQVSGSGIRSPSSGTGFLDLPLEVRRMVYTACETEYIALYETTEPTNFCSVRTEKGQHAYCTMKEQSNLFPWLTLCKMLYAEVHPLIYDKTDACFFVQLNDQHVRHHNFPRVLCPYKNLLRVTIVLEHFVRFARDFKRLIKKLDWGERLKHLEVEIGDQTRSYYGGVIKRGIDLETMDMVAYWGRIRMRERVEITCRVSRSNALDEAEEER
ncbi:Hypothetical protein D9617_27g045340 [Elsinoe fawcettii]|nr:Hypothetical protein D9617_27g045340 [Elsinoe fawcettii]